MIELLAYRLRAALDAIPWLGPPDPKPYARLARLTMTAQIQCDGELKRVMRRAAYLTVRLEYHALQHARWRGRPPYDALRAERRYAYESDLMLELLMLPEMVEELTVR